MSFFPRLLLSAGEKYPPAAHLKHPACSETSVVSLAQAIQGERIAPLRDQFTAMVRQHVGAFRADTPAVREAFGAASATCWSG